MSDKVAVIARIPVKPELVDEAAAVLDGLIEAAAAEAGTEVYACHREGESTFWFYELYRDQAALDVHSSSDAMSEALGSLGGMLADAPALHVLTPVRAEGLTL